MSDCVARLVHLCTLRMGRKPNAEPVFETLILLMNHFFFEKSYNFLGNGCCSRLSSCSLRAASLTGTPYNNGPTDLAAMMAFDDAAKSSARKSFWQNATMEAAAGGNIRNRVAQWHAEFLVRRRKEDVLGELVEKSVEDRLVSQFYAEQIVYNSYEAKVEPILKLFGELLPYQENPAIRKQLKELHTIRMAIMSSLRAANIHAMLPRGREYTNPFPPTRCHTIAMEGRPKSCVCCDQNMRFSILIPDCETTRRGVPAMEQELPESLWRGYRY